LLLQGGRENQWNTNSTILFGTRLLDHADVAIGQGHARHYPRDIAPFSAIAEPTATAYADLAADLPAGIEAKLFRPADEPAPQGWATVSARPTIQMQFDNLRNGGGLLAMGGERFRVPGFDGP
jgi:hypothetical protein